MKEVKIVVDSTQNPVKTTTTLYIKNYQYSNDTLTQANFEEGRARYQKRYFLNGDSIQTYYYDYFLKDHLGNTRIILTTERDTTSYVATMEAAYRATESKLFSNIASTSAAWTSMPNYQNIPNSIRYPSGVTVNDSVSKVDYNGTSGQTTGPGLLLKVMSGDAVSLGVQCYYVNNTLTTTNSSLNSVLNSLAGGIMGTPTGAAEGTLSGYTSSSGTVYSALSNFLGTNDPALPSGYPKAYLNWILLDDQFNYVSGSSGAVAAASTTYPANQMNTVAPGGPITMSKNGYLYVWVSNETQGWDVFFDNFSVQYRQGPVLEENHYYPFGLTMSGISDKAIKTDYAENKYRWNKGSELQNKEFSDGSGLEMYSTELRDLDPQLGRWWQIDPKTDDAHEDVSPYSAMNDDPARYNDPNGDEGEACCTEIWNGIKSFASDLASTINNDATLFNKYVNPVTSAVELATGKSFESGFTEDKSRLQSATEVGLAAVPVGKIAGVVEKVAATAIEKAGEQTVEKAAEKVVEKLPDDATVVRGGTNTASQIEAGTKTHPEGPTGVSVECGTCSVKDLSKNLPHNQIGVTTVGNVRAAGGDVIKTSGASPNHATLTGLSADKTSKLLTPTIKNPNKP